jgi:transcriptional antiterminator NusG
MATNWYVLKVIPGKERQITEHFNTLINVGRLGNINRFICPLEKEFVTTKKKKVLRDKVLYNGYLYFETQNRLNEDELKEISMYPSVMSILGDKKPRLMSASDVHKIIKDEKLDEHQVSKSITFLIGEEVVLTDGPFASFNGTIIDIIDDKVSLSVKIFGRNTPVTISIDKIQKI